MAADRQAPKDNTNSTSKGTAARHRQTATNTSFVAAPAGPLAYRVLSLPSNGKVSISHLVDEGLLIPGNTVVCNNWPFRATVTAKGTFEGQWTPLPSDFVSPYGTEFMRPTFETPSAWATAVCRVMRAQAKAPHHKTSRSNTNADVTDQGEAAALGARSKAHRAKIAKNATGASGESRVAVNGWTACRVLVPKDDPNRELAERLDSLDDSSAASANGSILSDVIEVSLDALRQELCARVNRTRIATKKHISDPVDRPKDVPTRAHEENEGDSGSDDDHGLSEKVELSELSGAVDGLAKRVESDLALGCVKQRRAAAMAADAISAASLSTLTITEQQLAASRKEMHSRKRKSIPDMSRHSKLSRIPSDNAYGNGDQKHNINRQRPREVDSDDTSSDDEAVRLDAQTQGVLAYFQDRAQTLKRINADLRTLRYQRKQRLKRSIASALDAWERQRLRQRQQRQRPKGLCFPEEAASAMVEVPLESGVPVRSCVQCGTTGEMQRCGGCGDTCHWFCAQGSSTGDRFVCAACRVCTRCLGDMPDDVLVQCRACGQHMHTQCSRQQSVAADGDGQWVCDDCVECLECGLSMSASDATSVEWAHDYCMCGGCARQIDRARVCPECIATYGNRSVGTSMVCCDICSFWVHTECDSRLTPDVYDALITLEDAPYVCPMCSRFDGALLPDIDASSASELDDDDLDDAAVAAIPALPRCLRPLVGQYIAPVSELEIEIDTDAAIATLLASQATLASPAAPDPKPIVAKIKPEADTAEAANLLLSLTRSDIRFDRDRFDVEALEARYCVAHPKRLTGPSTSLVDWRRCALCGLRGDGLPTPKNQTQRQSLGRLVPLATAEQSTAATRWAHVECLAWSWGPRPVVTAASTPVAAASRSPPMLPSAPLSPSPTRIFGEAPLAIPQQLSLPLVHFQGALLLDSKDDAKGLSCTLCGRPGASFHCCAPVACFDTAYHLPCLLLAGTPSPPLPPPPSQHLLHSEQQQPQYCAGWRRALCAAHAPEFSAMMPADGAVSSTSYDHVRVTATIDNMPPADLRPSATRIGNLFVFAWGRHPDPLGPDLHCLRFVEFNGAPHSLGIRCTASNAWTGWIAPGFVALPLAIVHECPLVAELSLSALLRSLFDRILVADSADSAAIDAAVRYPLRFLGLDRLSLALPGVDHHLSPIPRPTKS